MCRLCALCGKGKRARGTVAGTGTGTGKEYSYRCVSVSIWRDGIYRTIGEAHDGSIPCNTMVIRVIPYHIPTMYR